MRIVLIYMVIALISFGCKQERATNTDEKIRDQVIKVAKDYATGLIRDGKESVDEDGVITFSTGEMSCVIDPSEVIISHLNVDSLIDGIVPVSGYLGTREVMKEHLFILNSPCEMKIDTILFNVIRILNVEKGEIFAEISKVAMDAPGYGCAECMEIVRYRYRDKRLEGH